VKPLVSAQSARLQYTAHVFLLAGEPAAPLLSMMGGDAPDVLG